MIKKSDWAERLIKVIEGAKGRPFLWGSHDCCLFAASCVEAMTGIDPCTEFRGQYKDEEGAKRVLKELGSGTLYHTLRAKFGDPVHTSQIKRGDLAYMVFETGPAVGVSLGQISYFVGSEGKRDGLITIPTLRCVRGFKVNG